MIIKYHWLPIDSSFVFRRMVGAKTTQWPHLALTRIRGSIGNPFSFGLLKVWPEPDSENSVLFKYPMMLPGGAGVVRRGSVSHWAVSVSKFLVSNDEKNEVLVLDFVISIHLDLYMDSCDIPGTMRSFPWRDRTGAVHQCYVCDELPAIRRQVPEEYRVRFCIPFRILKRWTDRLSAASEQESERSSVPVFEHSSELNQYVEVAPEDNESLVPMIKQFLTQIKSGFLEGLRDDGTITKEAFEILSGHLSPLWSRDEQFHDNIPAIGMRSAGMDARPAPADQILRDPQIFQLVHKLRNKGLQRLRIIADFPSSDGGRPDSFISISAYSKMLGFRSKSGAHSYLNRMNDMGLVDMRENPDGYGFHVRITELGKKVLQVGPALKLLR